MKKIVLFFAALICFNESRAQSSGKSLQDNFMSLYNANNYQGIYNLGSLEWKKNHDLKGLTGWLDWMHGQTGQLISSSFVRDTGKYQLIRWEGEHKVTGFMFQPGTGGQFNDFYFIAFKEPISETELKSIHSDNPLKTPLDSTIHRIVTKFVVYNKPVGLSIGVIRGGKSYTYNYGTVAKGKQELPTASSYYETGSIIKTFTCLVLAKAVTDHKLSLQDDVRKYLDGDYSNLQYNDQPLRIVNLADYTSALPPVQILRPFDESSPQAAAAFFKTYTIPQFLADVKKVKLDTLPGTKYTYSTAGLNLLAYILSRVYNQPFPELVHQMITGPMGMENTKLYLSAADRKRFPTGYNANGEQPDIYGPLDSLDLLHSTVHDMLIYLKHQINEDSPAIALTHRQFSSIPGQEAGLGWFLYKKPYGKAIGKGGNSVHMSCRAWAVPEKKAGVIVFTNYNQMDWGDLVDDITAALIKEK
ncbi:MAG TPA: serine hydrolase domain-containing protein [Mucilaginibacter sp.]|jgi:CubicO group peptidase (beta-lactamase class C family)